MDENDKPMIEKKPINGITIVGYNLLALALYTLIFKLLENSGGVIFDAFVLFLHVVICLILSLGGRSWWWLLSALLVLIIGFSTCTMFNFNMH